MANHPMNIKDMTLKGNPLGGTPMVPPKKDKDAPTLAEIGVSRMDFILVSAFLCPGKKCGPKFTVYMAETLRTPNPQRPSLPRLRPYILKTQKTWTSETKDHFRDQGLGARDQGKPKTKN